MKINNIFFASFFGASMLLATDHSILGHGLDKFIADYLLEAQEFASSCEEKISPEQAEQLRQEFDAFLNKRLEDYVDSTASHAEEQGLLLETWFNQVKAIKASSFHQEVLFIKLWNQALRHRLDMCVSGHALLANIDELGDSIFNQLEAETRAFLAEWEDEKKLGPSLYSPAAIEDEIDLDEYVLVFDRPINVRGSHAKYLCQKKGSGLVFKIVTVLPHGANRSIPKVRQAKKLQENLDHNFTRKFPEEKKMPAEQKVAVIKLDTVKAKDITEPVAIKSELKERLNTYHVDLDVIQAVAVSSHQNTSENRKLGEAYYKKLPPEARKALDSGYKNYFRKHKDAWLNKDRENGKFIYYVAVIIAQENKNEAVKIDKLLEKKDSSAKSSNKENYQNSNTEQVKLHVEWQEEEAAKKRSAQVKNGERLMILLNKEKGTDGKKIINFIKKNREIIFDKKDEKAALFIIAEHYDISVLMPVISKFKNIKINVRNIDGETPLLLAASSGKIEVVKYLLEAGADKDFTNRHNQDALFLSIMGRRKDVAKLLLQYGAKPNTQDDAGRTPLIYALYDTEMLELLLKNHADPNFKTTYNISAFELVCMDNFYSDIKDLSFGLLSKYVEKARKISAVANLIKYRANMAKVINDIIDVSYSDSIKASLSLDEFLDKYSIEQNKKLGLLLKYKANVDIQTYNGKSPLSHFAIASNVKAVTLLFSHQATDIAYKGLTAKDHAENAMMQLKDRYKSYKQMVEMSKVSGMNLSKFDAEFEEHSLKLRYKKYKKEYLNILGKIGKNK